MKHLIMTFAVGLGLAACAPTTPLNVAACTSFLATMTETDPAKQALLAASNPACLAASADAINALIAAQASGNHQGW